MKTPSDARKRTLALQGRALRFSAGVNMACPRTFSDIPSATIWGQLVRSADSATNNLIEAEDASSTKDFLHKIKLALREAKEAKTCLQKLQMADLDGAAKTSGLEIEADELAAIFATIAVKVSNRLKLEKP
jgi:four helix bundle protein